MNSGRAAFVLVASIACISSDEFEHLNNSLAGPADGLIRDDASEWLARPDRSPLLAIQRMLVAYGLCDLTTFSGLLADNFRFDSVRDHDDSLVCRLDRNAELAAADHLFQGTRTVKGKDLPAARRIGFSAGPYRIEPDLDGRHVRVTALGVRVEIEREDGTVVHIGPSRHEFMVVRWNPSKAGGGDPATSQEGWLVEQWIEHADPASTDSALADPALAAPSPIWPEPPVLSLAPLINPARGAFTLAMTLPSPAPARLVVIDVAGRTVLTRAIEATTRRITIDPGPAFPAGIYWLRLHQGKAHVQSKIVLIR